jgi:hypothetical protein
MQDDQHSANHASALSAPYLADLEPPCVLAQSIVLSPPALAHHCPGLSSNALTLTLAIACRHGATMC